MLAGDVAKLDSDDPLALLQHWYLSRCDGEWEHQRGITIESLDNPGWRIAIDLGAMVERDWTTVERTERDWLHWRATSGRFEAGCGPLNLAEAIRVFLAVAGE